MPLPAGKSSYIANFRIIDECRKFYFFGDDIFNHLTFTPVDISEETSGMIHALMIGLDHEILESDWTAEEIREATIGSASEAIDVSYDNSISDLISTNVQHAIDELDNRIDVLAGGNAITSEDVMDIVGDMLTGNTEEGIDVVYDDLNDKIHFTVTKPGTVSVSNNEVLIEPTALDINFEGPNVFVTNDFDDTVTVSIDVQTAAQTPFIPNGDIAATNVQGAIQELRNDTDVKLSNKADINHLHDADEVNYDDSLTSLGVTNLQEAIEALDQRIDDTDANHLTQEQIEDYVGGMFAGNTEDGITATYDDPNGKINLLNTDKGSVAVAAHEGAADPHPQYYNTARGDLRWLGINNQAVDSDRLEGQHGSYYLNADNHLFDQNTTGLSATTTQGAIEELDSRIDAIESGGLNEESVQDIVGDMVSANTENGIAVTYDDINGVLNFDVNDPIISLTGAVTGSAQMIDLGNVSISTTLGAHTHTKSDITDFNEGDYVHITGNETISGIKTFNSQPLYNGSPFWHPDNDGPGSGLNADLLDGYQASDFSLVGHTHTKAQITDFNEGDYVHKTGNESISGIKSFANLIVSNHGAEGLRLSAATQDHVFMSFHADSDSLGTETGYIGYAIAGTNIFEIVNTFTGGTLEISNNNYKGIELTPLGSAQLFYQGNSRLQTTSGGINVVNSITIDGTHTVWHEGNDGAGSTLDADLLDGFQGTYYLDSANQTYSNTISGLAATNVQDAIDEIVATNGGNPDTHVDIKYNDIIVQTDVSDINFEGGVVNVTDDGDGTVTVSFGSFGTPFSISDEGVLLVNEPTDINFEGAYIQAEDDGDGTVTVSLSPPPANAVTYINTTSGLTAINVQTAIDELDARLDIEESHTHIASEIGYTNTTSGLTATDVQNAIDEIEGRLDTVEAGDLTDTHTNISKDGVLVVSSTNDINFIGTNINVVDDTDGTVTVSVIPNSLSNLSLSDEGLLTISNPTNINFVGDLITLTDDTDGTATVTVTTPTSTQIVYDNSTSGLTATNIQDAIDELDSRLDTEENHTHAASEISYDPSGTPLSALTVQSAINELAALLSSYRGDWNGIDDFLETEMVSHNNNLYYALSNNTNIEPSVANNTTWKRVVMGLPIHPNDGRQWALDVVDSGDGTVLEWKLLEDQTHFAEFDATFQTTVNGGPFDNATIVEKGHTVPGVTFVWNSTSPGDFPVTGSHDLKMNNIQINLDGETDTGNSTTGGDYTAPITEAAEGSGFEVTIVSGTEEVVKTDNIEWRWRRYWGVNPATSIGETEVKALTNSQLALNKNGTFNFDATGGNYLYLAWPTSFGQANQFLVGGFDTTFQESTVSITNDFGATSDYYVYRSEFIQNDNSINVAVS